MGGTRCITLCGRAARGQSRETTELVVKRQSREILSKYLMYHLIHEISPVMGNQIPARTEMRAPICTQPQSRSARQYTEIYT
eukprot:4987548-Pleurochrysis_carterae.AAC.2